MSEDNEESKNPKRDIMLNYSLEAVVSQTHGAFEWDEIVQKAGRIAELIIEESPEPSLPDHTYIDTGFPSTPNPEKEG